ANLKKLLKTNQDSLQMKIELEQQAEREAIQQQYNEKIETQNSMLAQSNTELESAIDELKSTQNKLVNAEKMAALGGMVQGVAHELNTPIGLSITGTSHIKSDTSRIVELLGAGKMKKSDLDSYFSTVMDLSGSISTSLEKAASLIRSFKLVSVEQHEEVLQIFNVHGNLTDILHSINRSLVEKGVVIDNQIPQELSVGSYPGVFYQIYTNLINNALLHAFEGRSEGHIWIAAQMQGDHLSLSFKDDGCGMSDDVLAKLFDPFFTTKRANGGTGLGMNIVYNLVHEKLFGTIDVVSEEGAGTTFTILVPDMRPVEGEQPGQDMLSQAT
ncbi:MAG: sensor histidine kinase, partial [Pseudomonadales bacterium]